MSLFLLLAALFTSLTQTLVQLRIAISIQLVQENLFLRFAPGERHNSDRPRDLLLQTLPG